MCAQTTTLTEHSRESLCWLWRHIVCAWRSAAASQGRWKNRWYGIDRKNKMLLRICTNLQHKLMQQAVDLKSVLQGNFCTVFPTACCKFAATKFTHLSEHFHCRFYPLQCRIAVDFKSILYLIFHTACGWDLLNFAPTVLRCGFSAHKYRWRTHVVSAMCEHTLWAKTDWIRIVVFLLFHSKSLWAIDNEAHRLLISDRKGIIWGRQQ